MGALRTGAIRSRLLVLAAVVVLSATNSRDVIRSGTCSSGGNKTRTCTFTLNANAAVTANVQ